MPKASATETGQNTQTPRHTSTQTPKHPHTTSVSIHPTAGPKQPHTLSTLNYAGSSVSVRKAPSCEPGFALPLATLQFKRDPHCPFPPPVAHRPQRAKLENHAVVHQRSAPWVFGRESPSYRRGLVGLAVEPGETTAINRLLTARPPCATGDKAIEAPHRTQLPEGARRHRRCAGDPLRR